MFFFFRFQLLIRLHLLYFLQTGLHCKIGLSQRHYFFSRVGILHYQVAGIPGKFYTFHFAFSA